MKLVSKIVIIIIYILNILKNNYDGFIKFLIDKNILQLAIGIILGTQVSHFTNTVNNIILKPLIEYIDSRNTDFNKYSYNLFGINIKYGELLLSFIELITSLIIIYFMWRLTTITNFNSVGELLNNSINNISMIVGNNNNNNLVE